MQLDLQRIMNDALAGAVAFEAQQQSRGIPALETAAAAAILIGLDERARPSRGLGQEALQRPRQCQPRMILDNDANFTPFDMKGVDAQRIQLRNHEIESICHGMGVLPIVIGYPAEMLIAMHFVQTNQAGAPPLREGLQSPAALAGRSQGRLHQVHRW